MSVVGGIVFGTVFERTKTCCAKPDYFGRFPNPFGVTMIARNHLLLLAFVFIAGCQILFLPQSKAGEATNSVISFSSPAYPPDAGHHFSFERSIESLGAEIVHPRDPYRVILGKPANDWFVIIEPEICLPTTSGTASAKGLPSVDFNKKTNLNDLKKVLSHLDTFVMGKVEVRKGRWGLLGEGFFAQLSDSGNSPGPLFNNATVVTKQGLASLAFTYRVIDDRRGFLDVYAGARYNYLGLGINTSVDSAAVQNVSQEAVSRISQQISNQADSFISSQVAATQQAVSSAVQQSLSQAAVVQAVQTPSLQTPDVQSHLLDAVVIRRGLERGSDDFGRYIEGKVIRDALGQVGNQINNLVSAAAQERLALAQAQAAQAKNQLTSDIQNTLTQAQIRVAQAQSNLANALSQKIQSSLPTSASNSLSWVDPLVGMKGQINLTRVLFLASAADVGGFGVGSQITWNVAASVGVNFTRQVYGEIGYRYFYTDYSNNSGALFKTALYGAYAGIGIKL